MEDADGWGESNSLEEDVNNWIACAFEEYSEVMPMLKEIKDNVVKIEMLEKDYVIEVEGERNLPTSIQANQWTPSAKVQRFLDDCNAKFNKKSAGLDALSIALDFMISKFKKIVIDGETGVSQSQPHDDYEEEKKDPFEVEDGYDDQDMEDMTDWDFQPNESNQNEYLREINNQLQQEQFEKQKQAAGNSLESMVGLVNSHSVKLFTSTKFCKQVLAAQDYLSKNEAKVKGWFNLVLIKELMLAKIEIDLNYIDLSPYNIEIFGWKLDQPLIINIEVNELRLLNSFNADELPKKGFAGLHDRSAFNYSFTNDGGNQSYGCKDFIPKLFQKYVDQILLNDQDFMDEEVKSSPMSGVIADSDVDDGGNQMRKETTFSTHQGQKPKKTIKGIFSSIFGKSSVDDQQLAQLVELGYDVKVAKKALQRCNNELDKALDLIHQEEITGKVSDIQSVYLEDFGNPLIKMMLWISTYIEKSNKRCVICHDDLEEPSLKMRPCTKDVCEYIFEESFKGGVLSELKHFPTESHFDLSLASKAISSQRVTDIFEPFPTFFLKQSEMRGKRGNLDEIKKAQQTGVDVKNAKKTDAKNKDTTAMQDLFAELPSVQTMFKDVNNDDELRIKLNAILQNDLKGYKAYNMIRYILATNRSSIRLLQVEDQFKLPDGTTQQDAFEQYVLISQDPRKERKFNQNKKQFGSIFCFHGSSLENWYSILRNGLRNLSNTVLMTAGAAYGQGIYASSNFQTSYGYTARYNVGQGKMWKNCYEPVKNNYVMGIVEIIKRNGYSKDHAHNIVVVPDEDDIIIRYLLILKNQALAGINTSNIDFEGHYNQYLKKVAEVNQAQRRQRIEAAYKKFKERKLQEKKDLQNIQEKSIIEYRKMEEEELEKHFKQMSQRLTGKGSALASQRIQKDYAGLLASSEFKDKVQVDFFKDNMYIWRVKFDIHNYEISENLKKDFLAIAQKTGVSSIKLEYEVIFPENYPHEPFFIRVVSPRFAFRTGHVTVGGSICMQSLTPSGWSSARSLESYFVEIISLINEGDAKLDTNNLFPYSLQEAKDAFNRVARDHGWLK